MGGISLVLTITGLVVLTGFARRHFLKQTAPRLTGSSRPEIRPRLVKFLGVPGCEELTQQSLDQWSARGVWHQNFYGSLGAKFSPTEVTYSRYAASAELVFAAIDANLHQIAHLLLGLQASLLSSSSADSTNATGPAFEKAEQIRTILTENERALSQIGQVVQAVSAVETGPHTHQALERSLAELQALADRAKNYAVTS